MATVLSDRSAGGEPVVAPAPQALMVQGKKVLVVLPWQKQVSPITALCMARITDSRKTAIALHYGDAFVAHSRNSSADLFLSTDLEWMLTIDDDMVVPFGHAGWYKANTGFDFPEKFLGFNALDRLLSHGKTLVGALYFGRHPKGPPVYNEGASDAQEAAFARSGPHDKVKATRWVGTGCMLIHRKVFEDIEKTFPELARNGKKGGNWFTSSEVSLLDRVTKIRDSLMNGPMDGRKAYAALEGLQSAISVARHENPLGSGEDVSFCLRAAAAGHVPHVDMGLICGHVGSCVYGPKNTQ